MGKIRVTRRIKSGKKITYLTKDKGAKGKTPKSQKWFKPPKVHTGWEKTQPIAVRRAKVLKAHKRNALSSGRAMQQLANLTTDKPTRVKAQTDANYFFKLNKR